MLSLAKLFIILGLSLLVIGGIFYLTARSGTEWSDFPGNIQFQSGNFFCVFALGASILLSILLTLILNIIARVINH
jgi:hypothetical protein